MSRLCMSDESEGVDEEEADVEEVDEDAADMDTVRA